MSVSLELQDLILNTLEADTAVMALVDGIYDDVPPKPWAGPLLAYITFGSHDVADIGSECIEAGEHSFQIDCWTRSAGKVAAKRIVDAVKNALHEKDLTLETQALAEIRVGFRHVIDDPDGKTKHGIVTVTARIEER